METVVGKVNGIFITTSGEVAPAIVQETTRGHLLMLGSAGPVTLKEMEIITS